MDFQNAGAAQTVIGCPHGDAVLAARSFAARCKNRRLLNAVCGFSKTSQLFANSRCSDNECPRGM